MSVTFEVELCVAASVFLCPRQFQPGVLHLQHKMAFVEFQQSLISHHSRIIRNLLGELADKNLMLSEKVSHMGQRTTRAKVMSWYTRTECA